MIKNLCCAAVVTTFGVNVAADADVDQLATFEVSIQALLLGSDLDSPGHVDVSYDPSYQAAKHYLGYPFADLLQARLDEAVMQQAEDYRIVFLCTDDYQAVMPLSQALSHTSYIAVADRDAPEGVTWLPLPGDAADQTPAPFYLVWPGVDPNDHSFKWPYQLEALRVEPETDLDR